MISLNTGYVFFPNRLAMGRKTAHVSFNLVSLPEKISIHSMKVIIFLNTGGTPIHIRVQEISQGWTERALRRRKTKIPLGSSLLEVYHLPQSNQVTIDITGLTGKWTGNSMENHGVRLLLPYRSHASFQLNKSPLLVIEKNDATKVEPADLDWGRIANGAAAQNKLEQTAATAYYKGGEGIVEKYLPPQAILADAGVDEVIRVGTSALSSRLKYLITPEQAASSILDAVEQKKPFALIRLGDGEMLTLSQNTVLTEEEVRLAGGHFLKYAGLNIPDLRARDELVSSIYRSDLIGVPEHRGQRYQGLLHKIIRYYGWNAEQMNLTSSLINYSLNGQTGFYHRLFSHPKILLIGNRMLAFREWLLRNGYHGVAGVIPVAGVSDIDNVFVQAARFDFDVAVVSGGIAACILCTRLKDMGKVAIDFGHMADDLLNERTSVVKG